MHNNFTLLADFSSLGDLSQISDSIFSFVQSFMNNVLFFPIFGIPFIVMLLVFGGLFCTFLTRFVNVRMFKHAFLILLEKDKSAEKNGEQISHFHAFATALSGTIGLGTIAGVAIAVSLGGPGALGWMIIAGFFGMSLKFLEVTLAFKHRFQISDNSVPIGGPFSYINFGLRKLGFPIFATTLSKIYSVSLICSALFGSIAFQTNQLVSIVSNSSSFLSNNSYIIVVLTIIFVSFVVTGGLKRVSSLSSSFVPLMAFIYLTGCLVIIYVNHDNLLPSIKLILNSMFSNDAIYGGTIGTLTAGLRRAVFANEAGIGTAGIAHSSTNEKEAVKVGLVAMLEPLFDTMLVCIITGITIIVSGAYKMHHSGIMMSRDAFLSVSSWFPIFLEISAPLFAFTTIVTFSYYCEIAWKSLFNTEKVIICRAIILIFVTLSGFSKDVTSIAMIGDSFFMCSATINIVALIFMNREIISDLYEYEQKHKMKFQAI